MHLDMYAEESVGVKVKQSVFQCSFSQCVWWEPAKSEFIT